jgi:GAF domain-containing protein
MSLRALVAVPMIHEGRPIGVVSVSAARPCPFSDSQVALLKTFADQGRHRHRERPAVPGAGEPQR